MLSTMDHEGNADQDCSETVLHPPEDGISKKTENSQH